MMHSLKHRLDVCAARGGLSTADLAVWFDLSYQTVRSWRAGVEPYQSRRPQIEQRLLYLEAAVDSDPRLPVPLEVRAQNRKAYLKKVRNSYLAKGHKSA